MEGGIWYARALNVTSLSNKILVALTGIALIATAASAGTTWPFWKSLLEFYINIQDFFAGTGDFKDTPVMPLLDAGAVFINGARNDKTVCLPLFNVENFMDKGFIPSFNLKRRTLEDFINPDSLDSRYYYIEESTQKRVDVPDNEVKINRAGRKYHSVDGKFVIPEQPICGDGKVSMPKELSDAFKALSDAEKKHPLLKTFIKAITGIPLDVVETNPHTILVISFKSGEKQKLGTGFFKNDDGSEITPVGFIGSALVRIDGGSMCFLDLKGANYTPHLDHVVLPKITLKDGGNLSSAVAGLQQFAGANSALLEGNTGRMLELLTKANDFVTDYVILH
jgi:hypothetical protein